MSELAKWLRSWPRQKFMSLVGGCIVVYTLTIIAGLVLDITVSKTQLPTDTYERLITALVKEMTTMATMVLMYYFGRQQGENNAKTKNADAES